tara:strand:+ start:597 stop:1796 length:1200 start_codon:yes stop_codon:yes gene_type:complete
MLIDSFKPTKLDELYDVSKYVKQLDKWYDNLENKFMFCVLSGSTGVGKSILGELYLKNKGYEIMEFDIINYKNKNKLFSKITESFNSFDVCSMLQQKKKKMGYIIDNIDNNILSKNDIIDLHSLFKKNKSDRPLLIIGKYDKNPNYPKKKIEHIKMGIPSQTVLYKIGSNIIEKYKFNIDEIKLNILKSKCQNDIKKLIIMIDYYKDSKDLDINNIVLKDTDYNLFTELGNLLNNYKKIKSNECYNDQVVLLNYTLHQNVYKILIDNCKNNVEDNIYDLYKHIYEGIKFEYYVTKYQNWDIIEYIYYISAKYISYRLSKIKKNKNINTSLDYPKYCYILNQKNSFKKSQLIFKEFDFYDKITNDNFKLFVEDLFKNEVENKDIIDKLSKNEIDILRKII